MMTIIVIGNSHDLSVSQIFKLRPSDLWLPQKLKYNWKNFQVHSDCTLIPYYQDDILILLKDCFPMVIIKSMEANICPG